MRRIIRIAAILLIGIIVPLSAQDPVAGTENDLTDIIERGELVFGFANQNLPPFYREDAEGALVGLDVDIAYDIASILDVKPVFNRTAESYGELYTKLRNGEIDLIAAKFSRTLDRSVHILYSDPYAVLRRGIFVNKQLMTQHEIEGNPLPYLRSHTVEIGVPAGTSHEAFARDQFPGTVIIPYTDKERMYHDVADQEIAACLYDENALAKALHQIPELTIYTTPFVFNDQKDFIAIGIAPGHFQLKNWIDTYLETNEVFWTISDLVRAYAAYY